MSNEIRSVLNEKFAQVDSLLAQNFHDDGNPLKFSVNVGTINDSNFVGVLIDIFKIELRRFGIVTSSDQKKVDSAMKS